MAHKAATWYSTEPRVAMQSWISLGHSRKLLESIGSTGGTLPHDLSIGPNPATIGSVQWFLIRRKQTKRVRIIMRVLITAPMMMLSCDNRTCLVKGVMEVVEDGDVDVDIDDADGMDVIGVDEGVAVPCR